MLQAGIVGLPNVGKSTLFNALTAEEAALAAERITVRDDRAERRRRARTGRSAGGSGKAEQGTRRVVPATVEFVDIAGCQGASKGEGLGNQFLANIRETDAVIQVVRCFEDENIIHVEGSVDPIRDIETIQIELALADLASLEKRRDKDRGPRNGATKQLRPSLRSSTKFSRMLEKGHRPAPWI